MGRGACVPSAASGAGDQARRLGALLGALCLFPALVLLAWPGTPATRAGARAAQGDAAPQTSGVLASGNLGPPQPPAPRRRRYTLTPARLRWEHFNLTYKCGPGPGRWGVQARCLLAATPDRDSYPRVGAVPLPPPHPEALSQARAPPGFYPVNHTDCLVSPLHHCFDGPTAFAGCLDRLFVCASWARRGFCDARRRLMKRLCPSSCDFCYEFPFPTVAATPPPPRTKTKLVPEGRNVTFRCGQKILHKKGKVYWYKDQEPLEFSYPGYLALGEAHLSIIANAINEGTYTCVVRRRQRVLSTYSWRIRVRS
ncbi:hypothetical protein K5549_001080 [Capra hircus]|nr:hypothetical protein K5549_001080 [Capra hircus]